MLPRPSAALLVLLLLLGLLGAPLLAPAPVQASDGGLAIVSTARYEVLGEERRVRVTIDAVATSLTPDSPTQRFFYTGLTLTVQPGIVNASASSEGRPLSVSVVEIDPEQHGIEIRFDREVFHQQRYPFRVSFDLVDNAASGGSEVRVGRTLVAFPVWAFGSADQPGSTVEVVVPAEYTVRLDAGELTTEERADGTQLLRADQIENPLSFFAYVTADRPGAYVETPLSVRVLDEQIEIIVRAWDDDPAFGQRMAALMRDGMPVLGELIGFPLGFDDPLTVDQAAGSLLGDYAGFYLEADRRIQIHYEADPFVALHEAAHAWFNDRLFNARWILEAFASFYAELAAARLDIPIDDHGLSGGLDGRRIPLNEWGQVGQEELAVENYAYAATLELARLIEARAGLDGLRRVWAAAERDEAAYQPLVDADREAERRGAATQSDWQRFLDLIEERTAESYVDLWAAWVVTDDELPLLDERHLARAAYADTAEMAGEWELPPIVRHQLGSWSFGRAVELLSLADQVLERRSEIEGRAAGLGLAPSAELQTAFESGPSLGAALERAEMELAALALLERADEYLAREPSLLEEIGLVGRDPGVSLGNAQAAYLSGDLPGAMAQAEEAIARRSAAERAGRDRVALAGGGSLGLLGMALGAIGVAVQRGRARVVPLAP